MIIRWILKIIIIISKRITQKIKYNNIFTIQRMTKTI